jgi:sugar phosphate isomerase/epimerase
MKPNLAINTLAFNGYSWETALDEIARTGVRYVEPVFISKYDPALRESYFTAANAAILLTQMQHAGLSVRSIASHMDMGLPDTVGIFQKRMEFAKILGAGIILTNTSHLENERQFYTNMEILSRVAAGLELTIGLENPGDGHGHLMNNADEGIRILQKLNSPWVKLNYDFSNIHTLSKGWITYDPGLGHALEHIGHLHLKNVKRQDDRWPVCGLGEGIIDYKQLFLSWPSLLELPMSIELPVRFGYDPNFDFVMPEPALPPLGTIRSLLHDSIVYLLN